MKKVFVILTILIGVMFGHTLSVNASDGLTSVKPNPVCFGDEPKNVGICKERVGGGSACIKTVNKDDADCYDDGVIDDE